MELTGFDIIEELGRGGMATVWKARQLSLDRIVAIKVLDTEWAAGHDDVIRFQEEARAAARLKHGSIVQVYDFNVEGDVYYFVMEYIAGYTVGDWLQRKGRLPQKDSLLVADSVSAALQYAWENAGIVHCDIKPDNVMIDADGTVKVADLGLARTIRAMRSAQAIDEIMGTPQYISPEQASGVVDLDCRADIYSMGAMLYHMVTGTMLFEGSPDDAIIDQQISDTVRDVAELNPSLSRPMCWLIEKMLMKDRDWRQRDWQEVREDIQRVRKGRMPAGCKRLPKGASTMRRSAQRMHHEPIAPPDMRRRRQAESSVPAGKLVGFAVTVVVVLILAMWFRHGLRTPVLSGQATGGHGSHAVTGTDAATRGEALLKRAREWAAAHPEGYDEAIKRFDHVCRNAKGTPFAQQARREIARLTMAKEDHVARIIAGVRDQVALLVASNQFDEAITLCSEYAGPFSVDTLAVRQGLVEELRVQFEAYEAERAAEAGRVAQKAAAARTKVYDVLLKDGVKAAKMLVDENRLDEELSGLWEELTEIDEALSDCLDERKRVLRTFAEHIGQTVTLELKEGKTECRIAGIDGIRVEASEDLGAGGATRPFYFTLDDVSPREMLKRVGSTNTPPVALLKGIMAYEAKAWPHTRRYFEMCAPALRSNLIARVDMAERGVRESMAERDLARLLLGCGAQIAGFDETEWLSAVERLVIPLERITVIEKSLAAFKRTYEECEFAERSAAVVAALERVLASTREDASLRGREEESDPMDVPRAGPDSAPGHSADGRVKNLQPFTDEDFLSL